MKSVAPKVKGVTGTEQIWKWADTYISADVYVFTEAKIPKSGVPDGWSAQYVEGGIGPYRPWGTVIASPTFDLRKRVAAPRQENSRPDRLPPIEAATHVVDIMLQGQHWVTLVGAYGFMLDSKNGHDALDGILKTSSDTLVSCRQPVVVAGDLNLHPVDVIEPFRQVGFYDVAELAGFKPRPDGVRGTRRWTHRNSNQPGATVQELDFIFVSHELKSCLKKVRAGIEDFPTAFEVSDHAPVVAEFVVAIG